VAEVFRDNAAQTLLPALVPDAGLERANGRLWTLEAVTNQMLGPAFGAFLLGSALGLPFAVNALAYAVAAVLMAQLSGDFRPLAGKPQAWRPALAAAFGFLRGQPLLRLLAVITGFWNMFFAMLSFALILHAQENLRLSAQAYGFVLMGMAAGGALAGLVGDRIIARFGARRVMPAALMLAGVMMLMVPMMPNGWGLAGCFFVFELSGITWNIVSVSLRQRLVPDALRGRVNSIYRLLAWGMIPLGTALAGAMVGWAEPSLGRSVALTVPLWAAGGGLMAVSFSVLPALWRRLARPSGE
jgi:predicted MFS family arabinose efflux permease